MNGPGFGNTNSIGSIGGPPQAQTLQNGPGVWQNGGSSGGPIGSQSGSWVGGDQSFNPANNAGSDQTGGKMTTAQGAVYGDLYGQSQGMGNYFNQAAAGYNQNAPQIQDVSQLGTAGNYYQQLMQGDGGYAQNQMTQSTDASIAAQMAMANSTRGGAAARAGAQRAALQGAGAQTSLAANQSAQIATQEEQAGAAGMSQIGSLELQRNQNNAQLQQNNQQQINQMQQSLYGMGEQEQGLSLSEQQAYMANLLAAEGINTQQSQFNTQLGMQAAGTGLQTLGSIGSAAASDVNLKTGIQSQGTGGIGSLYGPSPSSQPATVNPYDKALNTQPQLQHQNNATATGVGAGVGAGAGALSGLATGGLAGAALGAVGGAATGGLQSAAASDKQNQGLRDANIAAQTGIGAGAGALGGAALGPIGAGVGALVGGGIGLVKGLMT